MKEREQKTAAQAADYLQGDRLEAESLTGVQTFMEITEDKLVEVQIDAKHLMEVIVSPYNMNRAYRKVISNGESGGVDSMEAKELLPYLKLHTDELKASILNGTYKPQPVRRVEIPKDNGKTHKLGIPTLVDRVIQQSISQVLTPMYEPQFSEGSFGFRPGRSAHDALKKAQSILNAGYEYAVGIDLERFFDTVNQSYLIELLSHTIKDGRVISLIHKYLYAGVMIDGVYHPTPRGNTARRPSLSKERREYALYYVDIYLFPDSLEDLLGKELSFERKEIEYADGEPTAWEYAQYCEDNKIPYARIFSSERLDSDFAEKGTFRITSDEKDNYSGTFTLQFSEGTMTGEFQIIHKQ